MSEPTGTEGTGGAAPVADPNPNPSSTPTPPPAPAGNDAGNWEREKRGLIAETQKERQARQKYEQEATAYRSQFEQAQRRIQALAGVNPRSEQEAEDEAIRAAFAQKFPHLADLTPEDVQALRDSQQQNAQLKASTDAMWKKHTNQVLNSIHAKVAERLNGEVKDLTPVQKATLRREYIAYIEDNHGVKGDYIGRHEDGDESLFDEFLDSFMGAWQEPIRRSVTSTEIGARHPLPSGKGRSIATSGGTAIDFKDEKKVQEAAVDVFKRFGGRFGQ